MTGKQLKNYTGDKYYNGRALADTGAPWLCVLSERSDGKSLWWVKEMLIDYFKTGHKFGYIRRYDSDVKIKDVNGYFADKNLLEWLQKAGYNGLKCYQGEIWLTAYDEESSKTQRVELVGHAFAINTQEHYKSQHFDCFNFLFEEFITKKLYLPDEFTEMQNLISTANREGRFRCVLIGNTVARHCPYLREMGIDIFKAKPGKIYEQDIIQHDGSKIKSAFEYVDPREKKTFFIGSARKSIVHGQFEAEDCPHLHFKLNDAEVLYKCVLVTDLHQAFHIKRILYEDPETKEAQKYLYVYPMDYEDAADSFDDVFTNSPEFDKGYFYTPEKKRHKHLQPLIREGRVLYADNLTGQEFKNAIKKHNPFI